MRITTYDLRQEDSPFLVKESSHNYPEVSALNSPGKIVDMMNMVFDMSHLAEEHAYLLCLNTKMKPIGIFEVSHGTVNTSPISARSIFLRALLCGAVSIILIHNHPSGDSTPSAEDLTITRNIKAAGELMDVPLLDHIIVAGNEYFSVSEQEML